jgi:hypothetical protein
MNFSDDADPDPASQNNSDPASQNNADQDPLFPGIFNAQNSRKLPVPASRVPPIFECGLYKQVFGFILSATELQEQKRCSVAESNDQMMCQKGVDEMYVALRFATLTVHEKSMTIHGSNQ